MFTCWKNCNQSACSNRDIMLLASSCTSDRQKCLRLLTLTRQKGKKKGKCTAYYFTCCNKTKICTKNIY